MKKILLIMAISISTLTACNSTLENEVKKNNLEIYKTKKENNITVVIENNKNQKALCSAVTNKRVIFLDKGINEKETLKKEIILKKEEKFSDLVINCY